MDNLLKSLGISPDAIHLRHEPEDTQAELLKLEQKYALDTAIAVDDSYRDLVDLTVPSEELRNWKFMLGTFLDLGGDVTKINSVSTKAFLLTTTEDFSDAIVEKAAFEGGLL